MPEEHHKRTFYLSHAQIARIKRYFSRCPCPRFPLSHSSKVAFIYLNLTRKAIAWQMRGNQTSEAHEIGSRSVSMNPNKLSSRAGCCLFHKKIY